jgi:hypothetical protein
VRAWSARMRCCSSKEDHDVKTARLSTLLRHLPPGKVSEEGFRLDRLSDSTSGEGMTQDWIEGRNASWFLSEPGGLHELPSSAEEGMWRAASLGGASCCNPATGFVLRCINTVTYFRRSGLKGGTRAPARVCSSVRRSARSTGSLPVRYLGDCIYAMEHLAFCRHRSNHPRRGLWPQLSCLVEGGELLPSFATEISVFARISSSTAILWASCPLCVTAHPVFRGF